MQKPQQKKPVYNPFEALRDTSTSKVPEIPKLDSLSSPETIKQMKNFSPMDLEKLNKAYAGQDQNSLDEVRKHLTPEQIKEQEKVQFFKRYKREEEEFYLKRKQEEEEKKRQEAAEELQNREEKERAKIAEPGGELPQGKVRKNIFGGNKPKGNMKIPPPSTVEYKPAKGAQ